MTKFPFNSLRNFNAIFASAQATRYLGLHLKGGRILSLFTGLVGCYCTCEKNVNEAFCVSGASFVKSNKVPQVIGAEGKMLGF